MAQADDRARDRVLSLIVESSGRDSRAIRDEESLVALEIDSLDFVAFVMGLEDEFETDLPEPVSVATVADLIAWVHRATP